MKQTATPTASHLKPPLHPYLVMLIAIVLPGFGQTVNNTPKRGLMMVFFMLILGIVTFNMAEPDVSMVGKLSGGIFIYAISVMDAYMWARYRWTSFKAQT